MLTQLAGFAAGGVLGMAYGDTMGAIPLTDKNAAPQTSGAAAPKTTANGTVATTDDGARTIMYIGTGFVIFSVLFLAFGQKFLKDARVA